MDTARQVIRWALPGWMAVLFWTGFVAVSTFIHGQNQPLCLGILSRVKDLLLPLGVITIPFGFTIYQLYHWLYWSVPIPSLFRRTFIDPGDRGKAILDPVKDCADFERIFDKRLVDAPPDPFKKWGPIWYKSPKVMRDYRENWHLADSAWYLALSDERYKNTAEFLEKRHQFLGDIYHSLGACYVALAIAYPFYILTLGYITFAEARTFFSGLMPLLLSAATTRQVILTATVLRLISLTINSAITLVAFRMFRFGRMASFDALLDLKGDVITNVMLNKPTKTSRETATPAVE